MKVKILFLCCISAVGLGDSSRSVAQGPCVGTRDIAFVEETARLVGGQTTWFPDIWKMATDGAGLTRLSHGAVDDPPNYANDPAWSPDGSKIVFVSERPGSNWGDLYTMDPVDNNGDLEGDNLASFANLPSEQFSPTWSPDGNEIVYVEEQGDSYDLYKLTWPPPSAPRPFVTDPDEDLEPRYSPDGGKILLVRGPSGAQRTIVLRDLSNGSEVALSAAGPHQSPDFSPDGSRVVFAGFLQGGHHELYAMDSSDTDGDGWGDNLVRLTNTPAAVGNFGPRWSPDGACILFVRSPDFAGDPLGRDLWVMSAMGGGETRLTWSGRNHSGAWRP